MSLYLLMEALDKDVDVKITDKSGNLVIANFKNATYNDAIKYALCRVESIKVKNSEVTIVIDTKK